MTTEEIYKILGVMAALQEKHAQEQEAIERRMSHSSNSGY